jgi:hypothetical protein
MMWFALSKSEKEGPGDTREGQEGPALGVAAAISAEGDAEGKRSGTMEDGPVPDRQPGTKRDKSLELRHWLASARRKLD